MSNHLAAISNGQFSTLRFGVGHRGDVMGSGIGLFDSPPISSPLTLMVYLLPFLTYLAGYKSISASPPVRPGYDDKYHSRGYRFVERRKRVENAASDGLGWNFLTTLKAVTTKLYKPYKPVRHNITSCFRPASKRN